MEYKYIHTCIRVFNLEKSIEFYEKALNLKVSKRRDVPEHKFSLVFMEDVNTSFLLELTYNHDVLDPYDIGTGYSHIAFKVSDIHESYFLHKSMGLSVTDIKSPTGNNSVYFIEDPDGYKIEIIGK